MDKLTKNITKLNRQRGEIIIELKETINKLNIEITNLKYFIKEIHREYSEKLDRLIKD